MSWNDRHSGRSSGGRLYARGLTRRVDVLHLNAGQVEHSKPTGPAEGPEDEECVE